MLTAYRCCSYALRSALAKNCVGLPGLVAYLALLILAFWSALSAARFYTRVGKREPASLAWAGLASLTGMLVHGSVDATTWIIGRGAFVPWAAIGTLVALSRQPERIVRGSDRRASDVLAEESEDPSA